MDAASIQIFIKISFIPVNQIRLKKTITCIEKIEKYSTCIGKKYLITS